MTMKTILSQIKMPGTFSSITIDSVIYVKSYGNIGGLKKMKENDFCHPTMEIKKLVFSQLFILDN